MAGDDEDVVITREIGPVVEVAATQVDDPPMSASVAMLVLGYSIVRVKGAHLRAVFEDGGSEGNATLFSVVVDEALVTPSSYHPAQIAE